MWTIVTYLPDGEIYARSCVVDSWGSDFSYDEFDDEYAFDGISKVLYECKLRDIGNGLDVKRIIIISRDGVRYFDNDNYNGTITYYNSDGIDEDSLEHKNAKTYHDTQVLFLEQCFSRADELVKDEQARLKRLVQEQKLESERKKLEAEEASRRETYEKLKKEFGE